ncbi:MAG: CreA family protein, partial [Shewanella sp.]
MKTLLKCAFAATMGLMLAGCGDDVGKVSLGLFTTKDVIIDAKHDPKIPGVTCHISRIEANLDFADPSDMGISCRQTGP